MSNVDQGDKMNPDRGDVEEFAGGEVVLWLDPAGIICLKTRSKFNDPVELAEHEALALAESLIRLVRQQRK